MMTTIYLALGSNVGDRESNLERALEILGSQLSKIKKAPIYRSRAVGYTNQADFLNTAVEARTKLTPALLLAFIKQVEQETGRVKRFKWGPREIDIDIIFYGDQLVKQPGLNIPHKRFAERDFVLRPLLDLNPKLTNPENNLSIKEIYDNLPASEKSII